ncbi:MAG: hypothetical protein ACREOQ_18540 [Gemmatimonadales bacterium]
MANRVSLPIGKWLWWWWWTYPILVTVVGGVLFCLLCGGGNAGGNEGKEALALAQKIHAYLGQNNTTPYTGLLRNIEDNNDFHRKQYDKIGCSLWKLENPTLPVPPKCPPGGGTSSPTPPPKYP